MLSSNTRKSIVKTAVMGMLGLQFVGHHNPAFETPEDKQKYINDLKQQLKNAHDRLDTAMSMDLEMTAGLATAEIDNLEVLLAAQCPVMDYLKTGISK